MSTLSYVLTLRLKIEAFQEDILDKRFEISCKTYNACVNELYKRYRTMQQIKILSKSEKDEQRKREKRYFHRVEYTVWVDKSMLFTLF